MAGWNKERAFGTFPERDIHTLTAKRGRQLLNNAEGPASRQRSVLSL